MSEIVEALRDLSLFAQEGGGLGFFPDIALMLNMFVGGVTLRVQSGRGDHDIFYVCLTLALVLLSLFLGIYAPLDLRIILLCGVAFANIMMWVTYKDPTPADDRAREAEERAQEAIARIRREEARNREDLEAALKRTEAELELLRAQAAAESKPLPHVPLEVVSGGLAEDEARAAGLRLVPDLDVEAAAGTEAYVEQERGVGHLALPEDWLARMCINPEQCRSIRVCGRSMEPTLQAGARILVDPQRTRRLHGHIYVVWTEDGLVVKRLIRDGDDWLLVSDNEDQETYPPVPWLEDAIVRGEVMWTGKMLRGSR